MGDSQEYRCRKCDAELWLLQPACRQCETEHRWTFRAACHECRELTDYTENRCTNCGSELAIWRALEAEARATTGPVAVWKDAVPSPLEAGYRIHLGSIRGQWADYRRAVDDGGDFHVRSYARHYKLHHDDVSAVRAPGRHVLAHGPSAATASTVDLATQVAETTIRTGKFANTLFRQPFRWLAGDNDHASESGR